MLYQQIGGSRCHLGIGLAVVDQQEWQAPFEQEPDLPRLAGGVGHLASGELVGQHASTSGLWWLRWRGRDAGEELFEGESEIRKALKRSTKVAPQLGLTAERRCLVSAVFHINLGARDRIVAIN